MKRKLKEIVNIQIGYQLPGAILQDAKAAYRIIRMRDIDDTGNLCTEKMAYFTPQRDAERYVVRDGDVVFQARGSRNLAFMLRSVPPATLASNHFYIVGVKLETVLPEYIAWYINQSSAQEYLTSKAQGTTLMLVPKEAFESLEVDVPSLNIQRTIIELAALRKRERNLVENLEYKRDTLIQALSLQAIVRGIK
jgi:hypothetical protein